jgi:hypothetical protein
MARLSNVKKLPPVLDAAKHWINNCFVGDKSLFTQGNLWTAPLLKEASEAFINHPDLGDDDFITKLQHQMNPASLDAQHLMAEALWALLLFPSNSRPLTKRAQINAIWNVSNKSPIGENDLLSDAALGGIGSGGPAFNMYRPNELEYLLTLALDLKTRPTHERASIFADYSTFTQWINSVPKKGDRQYRHMLRYFAFPDVVERISANNDRRAIIEAFGGASQKITKSWTDRQLDEALLELRKKLEIQNPHMTLDFYEPPLRATWAADRKVVVANSTVATVVVPIEEEEAEESEGGMAEQPRQSLQVQALLTEIGAIMGFKIWLPPSDRGKIVTIIKPSYKAALLEKLPINSDLNTLGTVSQIDVIWLNRSSIVRAFEVEHTTAVYSGLLRMADLLALQPNMSIKLHIVAPEERKDKVFREMLRPVFTYLEAGPLSETCTFISYDSVRALRDLKSLAHTQESILAEYEEKAEIGEET